MGLTATEGKWRREKGTAQCALLITVTRVASCELVTSQTGLSDTALRTHTPATGTLTLKALSPLSFLCLLAASGGS